jgi:hypothetical protein
MDDDDMHHICMISLFLWWEMTFLRVFCIYLLVKLQFLFAKNGSHQISYFYFNNKNQEMTGKPGLIKMI